METEESAPEFDPFANESPKPARRGGAVAWLALLVALVVAGFNGWQWWQAQQDVDASARQAAELGQLRSEQERLEQDLAAQARRLQAVEQLEMADGIARLEAAIDQAEGVAGSDRARLESIEGAHDESLRRMEGLEAGMAALVVRGESPRQGLELAEVDYLLRSANERLRLYGDPRSADEALSLADAQLAAMDDPVYLPVRQSIAAARLAMEETPRVDLIGLTQSLDRLQGSIAALPFPGTVVSTDPTDPGPDAGVWERFKAAMSGLVSVRRRAPEEALISLEDKEYVRQGLWLQVESARLALLREENDAYQAALSRAADTLAQYFDPEAQATQTAAAALTRLRAEDLSVSWPDVSDPWTQLQRIRAVREAPLESVSESAPAQELAVGTEDGTDAGNEAGNDDDNELGEEADPADESGGDGAS